MALHPEWASHKCHSEERSDEESPPRPEILRFAQDDRKLRPHRKSVENMIEEPFVMTVTCRMTMEANYTTDAHRVPVALTYLERTNQ